LIFNNAVVGGGVRMVKILLVEDDEKTISDISFVFGLKYQPVAVFPVNKKESTLETLKTNLPTLVIMDSSVLGIDIINLVRSIRHFSDVPILVIGEFHTVLDRSRTLEAGADACIEKPYSLIELLAESNALLRRVKGTLPSDLAYFDDLTIDFSTHQVFVSGELVELTPVEYKLLSELARSEGRVISSKELLLRVWGSEYERDIDLVKAYVYRLRRKLELGTSREMLIINERGFGYRLTKIPHINILASSTS
jgi:DNA-binding response OmpR family regulator